MTITTIITHQTEAPPTDFVEIANAIAGRLETPIGISNDFLTPLEISTFIREENTADADQ